MTAFVLDWLYNRGGCWRHAAVLVALVVIAIEVPRNIFNDPHQWEKS